MKIRNYYFKLLVNIAQEFAKMENTESAEYTIRCNTQNLTGSILYIVIKP